MLYETEHLFHKSIKEFQKGNPQHIKLKLIEGADICHKRIGKRNFNI
jgi:hypothetical protein